MEHNLQIFGPLSAVRIQTCCWGSGVHSLLQAVAHFPYGSAPSLLVQMMYLAYTNWLRPELPSSSSILVVYGFNPLLSVYMQRCA